MATSTPPLTHISIKKTRESNVELLRIIATFMVLILHANFYSLGVPTMEDIVSAPTSTLLRVLLESQAICSVNVFVLISGWFSIKPTKKGLLNFMFQCLFFICGTYMVMLLFGLAPFEKMRLASCFLLFRWGWFIKAYLLLYIMSPILNAFVESANERTFRLVLLLFFGFQFLYGWLVPGVTYFDNGYSVLSFFGLYLIARYAYIYRPKVFLLSQNTNMIIFLIALLIESGLLMLAIKIQYNNVLQMLAYNNPIIIVMSIYILLYFTDIKVHSSVINKIAASSFAVFLLHSNYNVLDFYFRPAVEGIYTATDSILSLILIAFFLVGVFVAAIGMDQIRLKIWRALSYRIK